MSEEEKWREEKSEERYMEEGNFMEPTIFIFPLAALGVGDWQFGTDCK